MADARHQKRLRRTETSPSKSLFGAGNTEKLPSQMSTSGRSRSSLAIFRVSLHGAWPKRRKRHMRGNIEEEWLSLGKQWPTQESDLGTFLRKKTSRNWRPRRSPASHSRSISPDADGEIWGVGRPAFLRQFMGIPVETGALDGSRRPIRGQFRHKLTAKYGG